MMLLSPLTSRNQLGSLLTSLGLTGTAVEVGTHHARYARILLESWPGKLVCVDPWGVPQGYESQVELLEGLGDWTGGDREEDHKIAVRTLSPFRPRAMFVRNTSEKAAPLFRDNELDFVYLDADHRREMVKQDIHLWWPKLRIGGVLALHDFMLPGPAGVGNWGPEIQAALIPFAWTRNLYIYVIVEQEQNPWTAYLIKMEE
jgi:hypothetical protein